MAPESKRTADELMRNEEADSCEECAPVSAAAANAVSSDDVAGTTGPATESSSSQDADCSAQKAQEVRRPAPKPSSADPEDRARVDLRDIDLEGVEQEDVIPGKGTAHSLGRKVNAALCVLAFVLLFGYLFIAGEGGDLLRALSSFNYWFLLIALVAIVIYWLLESVAMQLICDSLFRGFSFVKTNIVTIIGQYFNSITPLSSGGQPMQAYYYSRFGLPARYNMPMLLCRFIVYQLTMTVYAVIVLLLRFNYFMQDLKPIMYLVAIGFIGGFGLIAMLLALAFAKKTVVRVATWGIRLLGRIGILKNPEETLEKATVSLEEAYVGIRFLLKDPALLVKVSLVTFVQLTVYFSLSWIIFAGFGLENIDYFTVLSCQAFIYLIASFVPLPGAIGAAEGSYIVFFNYVFGDASVVALSTFIWRAYTFYLPIVLGMIITLLVNNEHTWLARWIKRDDTKMAFEDHTVVKVKRTRKGNTVVEEVERSNPEAEEAEFDVFVEHVPEDPFK